jgi:hypothetical protein
MAVLIDENNLASCSQSQQDDDIGRVDDVVLGKLLTGRRSYALAVDAQPGAIEHGLGA